MIAEGNLARAQPTDIDTPMRDSARLVDRYAVALYELAVESNALTVIEKDMANLRATLDAASDLRQTLSHPLIDRATQQRVLKAVATNLGAHALTQKFVALVCSKKRQAELHNIIDAFIDLCATRRGELTAEVRVAAPLSPAQQDELARVLSTKHNATVKLNVVVDPNVLGGMAVKVGATLYDRTIQSQLTRLQATLEEAA